MSIHFMEKGGASLSFTFYFEIKSNCLKLFVCLFLIVRNHQTIKPSNPNAKNAKNKKKVKLARRSTVSDICFQPCPCKLAECKGCWDFTD